VYKVQRNPRVGEKKQNAISGRNRLCINPTFVKQVKGKGIFRALYVSAVNTFSGFTSMCVYVYTWFASECQTGTKNLGFNLSHWNHYCFTQPEVQSLWEELSGWVASAVWSRWVGATRYTGRAQACTIKARVRNLYACLCLPSNYQIRIFKRCVADWLWGGVLNAQKPPAETPFDT